MMESDEAPEQEQVQQPPFVQIVQVGQELQLRGNVRDRDSVLRMLSAMMNALLNQPAQPPSNGKRILLPGVELNGKRF